MLKKWQKSTRTLSIFKPPCDLLTTSYIESAKESDATYTGSSLMTPVPYNDYRRLTLKYPDLDIKCYLCEPHEWYEGDTKCDMAVTELCEYTLISSQPNLLNRTINVTELDIRIVPDDRTFMLFTILNTIATLPLKNLTLAVDEFADDDDEIHHDFDGDDGEELILPLHNKYTMTAADITSLQEVLNVESLRRCDLSLDCVLDVHTIYQSFLKLN